MFYFKNPNLSNIQELSPDIYSGNYTHFLWNQITIQEFMELRFSDVLSLSHEAGNEVHGNGEDHGGVPLCGDLSQRLQVAQLESSRRLGHDIRRLLQRARGLRLSLSSYHLYQTNRK